MAAGSVETWRSLHSIECILGDNRSGCNNIFFVIGVGSRRIERTDLIDPLHPVFNGIDGPGERAAEDPGKRWELSKHRDDCR